jgi:hypothetical protein
MKILTGEIEDTARYGSLLVEQVAVIRTEDRRLPESLDLPSSDIVGLSTEGDGSIAFSSMTNHRGNAGVVEKCRQRCGHNGWSTKSSIQTNGGRSGESASAQARKALPAYSRLKNVMGSVSGGKSRAPRVQSIQSATASASMRIKFDRCEESAI